MANDTNAGRKLFADAMRPHDHGDCIRPQPPGALQQQVRAVGLAIERAVMEAEGLCRACASEEAAICS